MKDFFDVFNKLLEMLLKHMGLSVQTIPGFFVTNGHLNFFGCALLVGGIALIITIIIYVSTALINSRDDFKGGD